MRRSAVALFGLVRETGTAARTDATAATQPPIDPQPNPPQRFRRTLALEDTEMYVLRALRASPSCKERLNVARWRRRSQFQRFLANNALTWRCFLLYCDEIRLCGGRKAYGPRSRHPNYASTCNARSL